ncbi:CACNA1S [Symbiodinium sp. CCMP2592]|nr:CACNA1S [Symbiodinium sp. CCMP2592]
MDRRSFEELLDESLLVFRQQLLESFPASAELELPADSGKQEDIEAPAAENPGGGTESLSVRRPDFQIQELESFELNLEHATGTNSVASMWSGTSDPTEPASPVLKMAAPYLTSRLNGLSDAEAQAVRRRLRLRLGILSPSSLVTGKALHDAVNALGLTRYKLEDMNSIVNLTSDFIDLKFQEVRGRRMSLSSTASPRSKYGRPIWKWPPYRESMVMRRASSERFGFNVLSRCMVARKQQQ